MSRQLTPAQRKEREWQKAEDKVCRELAKEEKDKARRESRMGAPAYIKRIFNESPEEQEARAWRRQHLRKEWLFAKEARKSDAHQQRLALRRKQNHEAFFKDRNQHYGVSAEDAEEEEKSTPRKRLRRADLLPKPEAVVGRTLGRMALLASLSDKDESMEGEEIQER